MKTVLYMLHRESKKLLLNDSDQSIIARAAPQFMCSSGGIMSHCASQMCWHQSQVVMCQNNFDIQVSQFSTIVDSFSSVSLSNIANPCVLTSQVILLQVLNSPKTPFTLFNNNVSKNIWDLAFVYPCQPPHFIFHFERI